VFHPLLTEANPPRENRIHLRPGLLALGTTLALLLTAGAGAPAPAQAQNAPSAAGETAEEAPSSDSVQPGAQTFGTQVDVRWVLVPTLVKSRKGYVQDLEQEDFRLFVDDRPVPIASFETGTDAPISVIYMQDLSGSVANGDKLEISRQLLNCFLDRSRPYDDYTIATFGNERIQVEIPATSDFFTLRRSMWKWEPRGTTALHDAVAWLPDLGTRSENAKRVAILVTDGADNASTLSGEEARALVRQAELPVYVLGLRAGTAPGAETEHLERQSFLHVLRLLAFQTGGRYASLSPADDVRDICESILEDLRYQYVLGFPAGAGDSYRQIRVDVEGRNRQVTARRGYTGGVPAPQSSQP
jgi:VWFA-related protein